MKIRWTKRAIRRLLSVHAYISKDSPDAAARVAEKILNAIARLENSRKSGAPEEASEPAS